MRSIFQEKPDPLELRLRVAGLRGFFWTWTPPILAMIVIANESTARFSANNTSLYLRPIFERYFGHVNDSLWAIGHHVFRKSGHFCGYGLVCLTFLRAWLLTLGKVADLPRSTWRWRSVGLGLLCQFLVASADEYHQTFLPSRTGMFSDVLLDTAGGLLSCVLVWFFFWRRRTSRRRGPGSPSRAALLSRTRA